MKLRIDRRDPQAFTQAFTGNYVNQVPGHVCRYASLLLNSVIVTPGTNWTTRQHDKRQVLGDGEANSIKVTAR